MAGWGWSTILAIYFLIWWTVIFAILPFGVRSQAEAREITPGTDPGAPQRPLLIKKAIATTLISILLTAALMALLTYKPFGLDDIPFLPKAY